MVAGDKYRAVDRLARVSAVDGADGIDVGEKFAARPLKTVHGSVTFRIPSAQAADELTCPSGLHAGRGNRGQPERILSKFL